MFQMLPLNDMSTYRLIRYSELNPLLIDPGREQYGTVAGPSVVLSESQSLLLLAAVSML